MKPIKGLARGIKEGYRSGLELTVSEQLTEEGIAWGYESYRFPYTPKTQHYTPDFNLGGRECDIKEILILRLVIMKYKGQLTQILIL